MNAVGRGEKGEDRKSGKTTVGRRSVAAGRKSEVYTSEKGKHSESMIIGHGGRVEQS